MKYLLSTLLFFTYPVISLAAAPIINSIADDSITQGEVYHYSPSIDNIAQAGTVNWSKAYGPDDASVNPASGEVTWNISASMPAESFHLGLRASNNDGSSIETWILKVGSGDLIYIGPDEALKTLKDGMSAMDSGDTLVMRNGVWDANPGGGVGKNTIPGSPQKSQKLPSGDINGYTTLMAEDPGKVIIDGEGYTQSGLISMFGSFVHPDWGPLDTSSSFRGLTNYIAIKGLVLINSWGQGLRVDRSHHVKLIDIGVGASALSEGSSPNVYIYRSQHILIEGMYVWGHGRYKIQFRDSSESVVRRSVVRIDDIRIDDPIGGFIAYCSKNIEFQNNIVIDSDASDYWFEHNDILGGFSIPATNCYDYPENIVFQSSLLLNSDTGIGASTAKETTANSRWENIVAWDLKPAKGFGGTGSVASLHSGVGPTLSNKLTIGEVKTSPGWYLYSRDQNTTVSNSIFHRLGWDGSTLSDQGDLVRAPSAQFFFSDNNVTEFLGDTIQSGSPTVSNTSAISPNFRYITKLPDASSLRTAGTNGDGIGAELLMMVGKSGAHYQETDFNQTTDVPMWPFPGEEQMHHHFNSYRYTGAKQSGGTGTLSGSRGFAVPNQSLSHYVWTYIDTIAPPFRVKAIAEDGAAALFWDKPHGIGYLPAKYKFYRTDTDPIQLIAEQNANHPTRYRVENLTNGQALTLGVSAVSANNQESDIVYSVSVTPNDGGPVIEIPPLEQNKEQCHTVKTSQGGLVVFCL